MGGRLWDLQEGALRGGPQWAVSGGPSNWGPPVGELCCDLSFRGTLQWGTFRGDLQRDFQGAGLSVGDPTGEPSVGNFAVTLQWETFSGTLVGDRQ